MRLLVIIVALFFGWLIGVVTLPALAILTRHTDDVMLGAGGRCAYVCGDDAGVGPPASYPPHTAGVTGSND